MDHRGYNNDFMKKHDTPLATLYSTSVLENHHFNMAASILQDEASNIFTGYSSVDFKKVRASLKMVLTVARKTHSTHILDCTGLGLA